MTKPNLHLLPLKNKVAVSEVTSLAPNGQVLACDFYITDAETFTPEPWGYKCGHLINIDHHAPTECMTRQVSSANLALLWARANGPAQANDCVVINHTDCDSVLSSAIVRGDLEPDDKYGAAAIAADHIGKPNDIADLLQALDAHRCYYCSLRNLRLLEKGEALEPQAQKALDERLRKRQFAAQIVNEGRFQRIGSLAYVELEEAIDGEFLPDLLPDAQAILVCSPRPQEPELAAPVGAAICSPHPQEAKRWNIKLRLGLPAPEGFSLNDLKLREWDTGYGGRWNAGSNKRGKGTNVPPDEYAKFVAEHLAAKLADKIATTIL